VTDLVQLFLPTPRVALLLTPFSILYAWGMLELVGYLRTRAGVKTAYTRKIFHFTIFTMASILQLGFGTPGVALFGGIVALGVLLTVYFGEGHRYYEAFARPTDAPQRTLFILMPLIMTALGGLASNILFHEFAYVGYLVCGWGDAVAEPVGTRWGKHPYRVPSLSGIPAKRSVEGSLAVFVVGSFAAFVALVSAGQPMPAAATVGVACGFAGMLVEAISTHGMDNLTTQVAASAVAWVLL